MPKTTTKKTSNTTTKKVSSKSSTVKKNVAKSTAQKVETKPKKEVATENSDNEFMVTVSRLGLKKAVDMVSNALPSKEYNDAKSGIFLEAKYVDDEPMLFLTSNSLNVFITHGIVLQEDIGEGYVIPNGNSFQKIVSGLQSLSSPIDLSFDEEQNIFAISCGDDYESMVQHYDSVGFVYPPTVDEIEENDAVTMPVKFITEALDKIAFACSNDASIPELTGVLIEQTKDGINIVGGDGNRISYLSMKTKIKNPKSVIVGVKYLKLLYNILKTLEVKPSDIITLYLSDDKIYFVSENTTVGIQIFAGEYPIDGGYEQFVISEDDCEVSMTLEVSKFLEKLDLATLHNNSVLEPIMMSISTKNKKTTFKLNNTDISSNKFNVAFKADAYRNDSGSADVQISFTPSYLYDVLKALDTKQVTLSIQSVDGVAAIVRPVGMKDGDYCYTFSLN